MASVCGSAPTNSIEFMTYNVNYSRRAIDKYEEYSWENRRDSIYKIIKENNPTILFLQEILTKNTREVQEKLADYQVHFEPINSRDGICSSAIAIKKSFLPNEKQHKFSFNFDQFDKTAEKVMGVVVGDLCLVNVHCSMEEKGRMAMAENFAKCLPQGKRYRLIIAGDFNSFPDCRGQSRSKECKK